jgi:hypothetical protein
MHFSGLVDFGLCLGRVGFVFEPVADVLVPYFSGALFVIIFN